MTVMRKFRNKGIAALLALTLASLLLFCSCGKIANSASQLMDAVAGSVGSEIGSAVSEGLGEIKSGMSEAASAFDSAKDNIAEQIGSVSDAIGSDITSAVNEAINAMSSVTTTVDIVSMSESLDSLADEISRKIDEGINEGSRLISSLNENTSPGTSVSSDDTTTVPVESGRQYTFRNQTRYDEHYEKHGAEFGDITKEQYLELANELINSTSDRVLHKYSEDGDYMYFDQDTNYFLVLSEDGYIRTFFIPSAGINYWNRQ
jgi:hypothetical protein